jgi:hypothetical protein
VATAPSDGAPSVVGTIVVGRGAVACGVVVSGAMAVLGGLIFNTGSATSATSGALPALAVALIIATPSFLALLGLLERPWLLAVAGLLLFPMCLLSFSFLFFPLLVPAILFLSVALTQPRPRPRSWVQCPVALLSVVFAIAALLSLVAHRDPVERHDSRGSSVTTTDDVITVPEALASLGFFVAAMSVAALAPRDGQPARA